MALRKRRPWNLQEFQRELQRIGGDNLVAYWPLDDQSGTTARDIGPNAEVLDITGTTLGQNGPPQLGRSHYFDGINDVDSQHVYDDEQGNLTFVADGGTAEFRDDGQDFGPWATTPVATVVYMLVVTSNNGVSWGYMGADNNGGQDIDVYSDLGLTTRGWKGRTTPAGTPDTPASYEVRKTLFQIRGALAVGMWIYPTSTDAQGTIASKFLVAGGDAETRPFWLHNGTALTPEVYINDGTAWRVSSVAIPQNAWSFIVFVYDNVARTLDIYIDGSLRNGVLTGVVPASLGDTSSKLTIGSRETQLYFTGNISHAWLISTALDARAIRRLWEVGSRAHRG